MKRRLPGSTCLARSARLARGICAVAGMAALSWTHDSTAAGSAEPPPASGAPFALTIPGSADGATFPVERAASVSGCGGANVSPPLTWTRAPANASSFAVVMTDPDGARGLGVVHWMRYGIPAALSSLPAGVGTAADAPGVGGTNSPGNTAYHGPCPPPGELAHHYLIQIYALDLPPDALPAGLTRAQWLERVKGHVLAATSLVQRYGR